MTDVEKARYDGRASVELVGLAGLFKGEAARLLVGQCLVIGRSRLCGLSVARSAECRRLGKDELDRHKSYRKISRKHIRVCLVDADTLEIEDLSTNGTVVDGHRVDRLVIRDFNLRVGRVAIEFGEGELIEVVSGGAVEAPPYESSESIVAHREPAEYEHTPVP